MFNIAPYIAKYVRSLHALHDHLDIPYSQTQFGVVLMVDVVGFSQLTTLATEKGESGAEAIALEIGAYMGECIQIIEFFGGDVVKFLGDAVLVSFQQNVQEPSASTSEADSELDGSFAGNTREASERQRRVLVRRAVECGQQLLARLSHYRVYLTAEERTKHRTSSGEIDRHQARGVKMQRFFLFDGQSSSSNEDHQKLQHRRPSSSTTATRPTGPDSIDDFTEYPDEYSMAFDIWSCIPFIRRKNQNGKIYARRSSVSSDSCNNNKNAIDLELHIAVSCGDVTNVIIGEMNPEYRPADRTSKMMNGYGGDHNCGIGNSSSAATGAGDRKSKRISKMSADVPDSVDIYFTEYSGRLEYAISGPAVESLEDALTAAKAGEMSITPEIYSLVLTQPLDVTYEKRKEFYIVKSREPDDHPRKGSNNSRGLVGHHNRHHHHPSISSGSTPNASYLSTRPELQKQASRLNIEPLVPKIRNINYFELSNDSNANYYKYVNRSALYRLQHSPDGNFPAHFRDVTIMFVSLGKLTVASSEGLEIAQKATVQAMQLLVKYEGMLQQFAVDDKGATLLAVFGLPPLSHEREAVFAAKAAIELRDAYRQLEIPDFAIALSTGVVFNAVLPQGNPYRRDPSISGDTIILAVRLLKFPFAKKNVVCDTATKQQIGGLCEFEDMGENFVKGKVKPVQIYEIQKFGQSGNKPKRISLQSYQHDTDFIGYRLELARAKQFIDDWNEAQNHHVLIISGPSGVGKSFFSHALNKNITSQGVVTWWSSSTEVEKSSKYYLVRNLLLSLFEIIDSDKIPANTKRRMSHLNTTLSGNHLVGPPAQPQSPISIGDRNSSASSLSIISNREWLRRLASYSSATRSASGSMHNTDINNEMADLIVHCLHKCGEQESLLPLFKAAFASMSDIPENRYTAKLDGRARDILLASVITRMVRYVSEHIGLVLICDDVQWADSASIRVLYQIHEQCQRVMIIMATRQIRDYNVTFISKFCSSGSHEEIALNGLGADEIGEIILQAFKSGVKRVSPEIVRVVQKRTAGNPLYVKNMAIILKDFNHVTVVDGELVPSSSEFDLADLLGNFDYKRIIKMQFDRLDASFQEILTVASCLDQYFTLYEIDAVINKNNPIFKDHDMEKITSDIQRFDVYHFLQQIDAPNLQEAEIVVYTFSHITIPQAIYDMVSYETRIILHQLLAKYYESQLTRENYPDLLSKVVRHYMETDALVKQLFYLEQLADLNIKSYLLPEATDNLKKIVEILDKNESIAAQFGRVHYSDIYRRLGMCYTMRTKLNEGERYLFMALDALGEPWPRSELEFMYKFWTNRAAQYHHRRWGAWNKYSKPGKKLIWKRVVEIMAQLSNIYFYTGKGHSFVYTCLIGLNACERLNEDGPNYTLFLARNSLLSWINDQKEHSIFYITKALRHMEEKNDPGTLTICAFLCFAAGKFNNARDLLYQSIQAVRTLGVITDCQAFYRSVGLVITMRIFEGRLDSSPEDLLLLKQMADTAHSNGDYEAEIWLGVYNIGNAIVMDRLRDCDPFVALLEAHVKQAADYNKIAIHGTLIAYYARARNYEYARRHLRNLVNSLPALTVTPNTFPIFGLIFATMGLYRLIEYEQVDLVSMGDARNYDRFNLGVARINHAFQQVKFWEFTQPCLYLARALPYISTGRTVEGYLVLRHGIYEMHFIQEIRFLKAYYWANLGKYAFTPSDRIEWTDRARTDLDQLNIPAHIYCNPDPANLYSRGKPADLCA
ncbi:hypothetical protein BDA99DRAFT_500982 [Phascolomyces articulosus]|uniref:Guanylate cyclase domain-containing protein n=1 Tax=Phascolomyces articulosus TaxID=60185 RepID=A0AAD5K6N4_9FUNG|nr:hypothetical protein BDA99DRAFT_500982 [Phascolomyces articulosus]